MFPFIVDFIQKLFWGIVLVGIFPLGCTSVPEKSEKYVTEGSGVAIPPPGSRVMLVSNHKGSLNVAAEWLRHRGFLIVDQSRVDKEITGSAGSMPSGGQGTLQIQEVAKAVDAEMVISAHVGRKFVPADFGSQAMTIASVEIQGTDVQTGKVAFESNAWNSDPVIESERTVGNLTEVALQQAWKGKSNLTYAPVEVVTKERSQDSGVVESRSADIEKSEVVSPPQTADHSSGMNSQNGESSLGLQVASGALSILYTPFKVVYAGLGGIMGGLAYALTAGNDRVSQAIWDASLGGDYWITPPHLDGSEPIHFRGPPKTVNGVQ